MTAPLVSVVVPTAGRPAQLARCVDALRALDEPDGGVEIVVVVDGDDDVSLDPQDARIVRHASRRGPGAARNTGAAHARGDVLAFTDDDCLPARGWLRALVAALAPGIAVGGRTTNALSANWFAEASQHIVDLVYAHYNRDRENARFLASNNLAVRRDDFLAVGGFDATRFPFASEDRDFCDRWRASGRTLRYAPGAVVDHAHDLDLGGFVAQHVAYGRGAARYHRARRARGTGRLRDDLPFHLDLSLYVRTARLRPARRAARVAALLPLWQVANAAGYALERRRDE